MDAQWPAETAREVLEQIKNGEPFGETRFSGGIKIWYEDGDFVVLVWHTDAMTGETRENLRTWDEAKLLRHLCQHGMMNL
jgi:hypothetical protein